MKGWTDGNYFYYLSCPAVRRIVISDVAECLKALILSSRLMALALALTSKVQALALRVKVLALATRFWR